MKPQLKITSFQNYKNLYLIHTWSEKAFKSTVVNRTLPSLFGGYSLINIKSLFVSLKMFKFSGNGYNSSVRICSNVLYSLCSFPLYKGVCSVILSGNYCKANWWKYPVFLSVKTCFYGFLFKNDEQNETLNKKLSDNFANFHVHPESDII